MQDPLAQHAIDAPFDKVAMANVCEGLETMAVVEFLAQCVYALLLGVIVSPYRR